MALIGEYPINNGQKIKRTDAGIELIRVLASEGYRIFSTEQARQFSNRVGLKPSYLAESLYHLRRNEWLIPIRRGLYAISPTLPGVVATHEFEIAMALVDPAAISHWSALHHHGLTEQSPRKVFVLTSATSIPRGPRNTINRLKKSYHVGDFAYQFIQVKAEKFFGTEKVWISDVRITITDPERTLLDGLSMPQYCGDFAEVLHAFEVRRARIDVKRIIDYALRLDEATVKRLGWVLETQGMPSVELDQLQKVPVKGYRKLDPTGPRQGPYNRRWMIQENLPGHLKS